MDHGSSDLAPLRHQLKGTNLYLIGMMGSGKTTVGQLLARELEYRFLDLDAVIEQVTGQSITTLFATIGETAFRDIETQVLAEVSAYTRMAIATGGGIILRPQNWSYLHHGVVVWLSPSLDILVQRLQGSVDRPLLQVPNPREALAQLLQQRMSLYAQADIQVTISQIQETPDQTTIHVLAALQQAIAAKQAETQDKSQC
jgi:shikimate kinase